ncbi:diguanylate cyclase domain-containing protein [Thermodesulfobacteriota bacterium]
MSFPDKEKENLVRAEPSSDVFDPNVGNLTGEIKRLKSRQRELEDTISSLRAAPAGFLGDRFLMDHADEPIMIIHPRGYPSYVNRKVCDVTEYSAEELTSMPFSKLVYQNDLPEISEQYRKTMKNDTGTAKGEFRVITKSGDLVSLDTSFSRIEVGGRLVGILSISKDMTERKKIEGELQASKDYFEDLLENASEIMCIIDFTGRITYVNKVVEDYGFAKDDLLGRSFLDLVDGDELEEWFWEVVRTGRRLPREVTIRDRAGKRPAALVSSSIIPGTDERPDGLFWIMRDITEKKKLEEDIKRLLVVDELTKLYNRRELHNLLSREIERHRRYDYPLSLIFFDIDRFKAYNDTYGHPLGDKILQSVGRIVSKNIREIDTGFRYGGDEFIILLPYATHKHAREVANRIRQAFEHMPDEADTEIQVHLNELSLSMGIAECAEDDDVDSSIKKADDAMYHAKNVLKGNAVYIMPS